ncbi:lipoxygenase homology domain-containing protein 1-like isoform X2 [Pleurodeles waltl]|uniref:lipoxygenase homology domain-containing protein 1-like isoform X2 n=1 Tax=Pleurodeles waltl TaxID=8319 RepID=UPI0037098F38
MSESTTTSYSGLQPYSSESAQTASTRHSNVTEPVVSKRVCFYKSGDPQFNGIKMVVSNRSFKTFDALLDGLSKKVPLPFGVRNISTPRGIHQVSALDELEDGKSYICSHQKKIKPVNLERASRKPLLWQSSRPISARRRVVQLLRQNEVNPAPGDNTAVPGLSKKLVIFKNGDTGFKHTIILSKKNTQNFEALLDHMTEVMQCPVTKLYTADGRRIFGMQALLLSSGAIVAAGREPFKPRNYDPKKESLPVKLPGIPRRVLPKARNKPEPRNPGQWKVSIFTSDMPSAGTTAQVYITLYGHHRFSGPTFLYGSEEDLFQSGHQDIFTINTGDIGDIYKIRIGHNNSGDFPAWHCEEVQLQNLCTKEQFYIPVHRWLAKDQEDGEICRELPVLRHGHPILPVTLYEVQVLTGDLWNAGTGANVYISIYGDKGDAGSRHLHKSRNLKTFAQGQTDIFQLEAVHLGNVHKIVIGHDGLGAGSGWYLEKVIVQDPIKDTENVFLCHRWLDQGEDDGKIVRELYTDISNFSARQELELKRKEIWGAERWKYQKGNTLQFYCKVTRRLVRLMPNSTVDALGDKKDKHGFFDVTVKRGHIRVFTSRQICHLALAIDKGFAAGMDNYGNLCELQLHVHPNRCVTLESVRAPGHIMTFNPEGKPAEGAATGYAGISKEFVVHVKGVFHNGAVVLLTTNWCQALCLRHDGSCSATGSHSEESYWRVHKISSGVCMFESVRIPRMFLRIKDTHCDGRGTGDQYCHFKIEKNLENGSICLESVRSRGMYVGFLTDGRTKPLVHTGERNVMIYPQVIKFGREKPMGTSAPDSQEKEVTNMYEQDPEKPQKPMAQSPSDSPPLRKIGRKKPMGTSASDSQEKEVTNIYEQDPEKPQKPVAQSPSDSPPLSKKETKTAPAPSDDDWKVLVLTGDTGTRAPVTLWVYGDKGTSGPVKLENDEKETLFIAQQEDEFKVKLKNIGRIYKIRIGHDGSSEQPEWKLKQVTLVNMKSKKIMLFEVNRWLSRSQRGGDIVCEVPVTKNGKAVYPVVRYQVYIYTGNLQHAETNAPVYLCIFGERGDSGLRLLHKSDVPVKFQRGEVDRFEVEAVSLGRLRKVLMRCESSSEAQSWYCEKVIIKEPGKESEYIFGCERWLPFMSQGRMHSEIELQVQDMQINDHAKEQEKNHDMQINDHANEQEIIHGFGSTKGE